MQHAYMAGWVYVTAQLPVAGVDVIEIECGDNAGGGGCLLVCTAVWRARLAHLRSEFAAPGAPAKGQVFQGPYPKPETEALVSRTLRTVTS